MELVAAQSGEHLAGIAAGKAVKQDCPFAETNR